MSHDVEAVYIGIIEKCALAALFYVMELQLLQIFSTFREIDFCYHAAMENCHACAVLKVLK